MFIFKTHAERVRSRVQKQLEEYSRPSLDFFVLIALSSAIASLGLMLDNTSVVIGAMVVAPIITPIFGLSLALLILRFKRMGLSLISITAGVILAIFTAAIFGFIVETTNGGFIVGPGLIKTIKPNLTFFLVAVLSGMAGAYAYARPKTSAALPGIAISVAIIPPLSLIGLSIAEQLWNLAYQAGLLFIFNLAGIIFGSVTMFIANGSGHEKNKIEINK